MPGSGLHLILASRVLSAAPGAAVDRESQIAFFAGAVAPDMGYCPGGDHFTSDLAHYVRSGGLVRSLQHSARGLVARAFARGWATHVLADALIHPSINRAAGELTNGSTAKPRTFHDGPADHVRVEQGLDAVIANRFDASALWPSGVDAFVAPAVELLAAAYWDTYGYSPEGRTIAASCRALARSIPVLLQYGRIFHRMIEATDRSSGIVGPLLRIAGRATSLLPRSPLAGFLGPVNPTPRLIAETVQTMATFADRFVETEKRDFADLPDFNLDTGESSAADTYVPALATRDELLRRGGTLTRSVSEETGNGPR